MVFVMKKKFGQFFMELCCSYTFVSVIGAVVNMIGGTETNNVNVIMMFVFCTIACIVLNLHKLFDYFSPLFMIVVQYVIATILVFGTAYMFGLTSEEPLTRKNWYELFRSFTIPYFIGAGIYYYGIYAEAKVQSHMIKEIQMADEKGKSAG